MKHVIMCLLAILVFVSAAAAQPVEIEPSTSQTGLYPFWPVIQADVWWPENAANPPSPPRILGGAYSLTGVPYPDAAGNARLWIYAGSGAAGGPGPGSECPQEQTMIFRTGYHGPGIRGLYTETYHGLATPCETNSTFYNAFMMPGGALVDPNRGTIEGKNPEVFLTMEAAWTPNVASGFHHVVLGYSENAIDFAHLLMIRVDDSQSWGLHAPHCQPDETDPDRWFCFANVVGTAGTAIFEVLWDQPAPHYGRVRFCMNASCTSLASYRMGGPLTGKEGVGDPVTQQPYLFRQDGWNVQGLQRIDGEWVAYGIKTNWSTTAPPCNNQTFADNVARNGQINTDFAYDIVLFKTSNHWARGADKILSSNVRAFPGWGNTASSFPYIFEGHNGMNFMYSTTQDDTICDHTYLGWQGQRGSIVATRLSDSLDLD